MKYTPTMLVSQLQRKESLFAMEAVALKYRLEEEWNVGNYRSASRTADSLASILRSLASTLEEIQSHDL